MKLSTKQQEVVRFLRTHDEITITQAVDLIGKNVYDNVRFHVGNTLARMVARGILTRIKPGHFKLAAKSEPELV